MDKNFKIKTKRPFILTERTNLWVWDTTECDQMSVGCVLLADFFIDELTWDAQNSTILTFEVKDQNGHILKWIGHLPRRYLEVWHWKELSFDIKLENSPATSVAINLWQPNKNLNKMWLRDIELEQFDELKTPLF